MNTNTKPAKIKSLNQLFLSGLGEVLNYRRYLQTIEKYNGKIIYTGSIHVNYTNGITQVFNVVDENGDIIETTKKEFMIQAINTLRYKIKVNNGDVVAKVKTECLD